MFIILIFMATTGGHRIGKTVCQTVFQPVKYIHQYAVNKVNATKITHFWDSCLDRLMHVFTRFGYLAAS